MIKDNQQLLLNIFRLIVGKRGYKIQDIKEEKDNQKCQKCRVLLC